MTTHTAKTGTDLRTDLSDTPGRRERFGLLVIFQILSIFHSTHLCSCSDLPTMEESSIPGSVATGNSAHLSTSPSSGDGERSFRRPVPWSELPCSRNATIRRDMPRDAQGWSQIATKLQILQIQLCTVSFGLRDLLRDLQMTKPKFNKSATSAAKMI